MSDEERSAAPRPTAQKLAALFLVFLLTASFAVRVHHILENSPYPRHVDEETFVENSLRMLKEGTLQPKTLNWPTLPIYLGAAAQAVGLQWSLARGNLDSRDSLRPRAFPYYKQPKVIVPARLLFAALSVATLLFVGLIAWKISGSLVALGLAPAVLSLNALFLYHSWSYLNVDIVGCFFIVGALAHLVVSADDRIDLVHKALIPGVWVGLATASKYTNAAIALPFLISIAFARPRKLVAWGGLLGVVALLTFAIAMPYALIDSDRLVHWILRQREIYAEGWPGYTVEAGLPHFVIQMRHLVEAYGTGLCLAAAVGLGHAIARAGRKGLELAIYPVLFTIYFCSYRVDLVRNLLAVHALVAAFAAIGLVEAARWLAKRAAGATSRMPSHASLTSIALGVLITATFATAPWREIRAAYLVPADSRHRAIAWILANVPQGTRVVIAEELRFDVRPIFGRYELMIQPFARRPGRSGEILEAPRALLGEGAAQDAVFVVPEYGWMKPWSERAAIADALNARFAGGETLASFGSQPVPVKYFETVPDGDPMLTIRRGVILSSKTEEGAQSRSSPRMLRKKLE